MHFLTSEGRFFRQCCVADSLDRYLGKYEVLDKTRVKLNLLPFIFMADTGITSYYVEAGLLATTRGARLLLADWRGVHSITMLSPDTQCFGSAALPTVL